MEKILLITISILSIIVLFINIKNISFENFIDNNNQQLLFPGQTLNDLKSTFEIDYNFNNNQLPISNDKEYNSNLNYIKKYSFLDEVSYKKINFNPINASKVYEKKLITN